MAYLSKLLRIMKQILILLLAIMPIIVCGQELSKNEKKAQKAQLKAERREARRIADSIELNQCATRDARLAAAKAKWIPTKEELAEQERLKAREGATSIVCRTIFDSPQEAFDLLIQNMLRSGIIPSDINEKYFIVKTPPKQVGHGTYELSFSVYLHEGKATLRASGTAYGQFSIGAGIFRSETNMVLPVECGGHEDSLFGIAWAEMEAFVKVLPHEKIEYLK